MAKKSNISILNPIVRKHIREEEKKRGTEITGQERHEFIKNDKKQIKKNFRRVALKSAFGGLLAALGITVVVKALPEPKNNITNTIEQSESKSKGEQFKQRIQDGVEPIYIKENPNKENISEQIAEKYNSEYNKNLSQEDIGYIQSKPQFFKIDENGNYVFDYRENVKVKDYKDNDYNRDTLYIIINKKDNEIISAIGEIDNKIVNVQAKQVMTEGKEYLESKETLDLTLDEKGNQKSAEEKDKIYENIEKDYQSIVEKNNDGMEIG